MSGLPTDVGQAADKAVTAIDESMRDHDDSRSVDWDATRMAIGAAILAERERCAKVAEGEAHADCNVAEQIASAIRAGDTA